MSTKTCCGGGDREKVECCDDLPFPANLEKLVEGLNILFSCPPDKLDKKRVHEYMSSYKSKEEDWQKKYAKFSPKRYTRNLVDKGNGHFNLLVLCWGPGQGSSIHSHCNSDCYMKILDGEAKETRFDWPGDEEQDMKVKESHTHKRDDVTYICDEMGLHRVENPSNTDGTVTLHLYSPPFNWCYKFDDWTGHKDKVQMTFDSEFGEPKTDVFQ